MSDITPFAHDPDEAVSVTGIGTMPLRTAAIRFSKLPPLEQTVTLIFRDMSATPSVLRKDHVDWLRTLPAYQDAPPQDVETAERSPIGPGVPPSQATPALVQPPVTFSFGLDGSQHTAWRFYLAFQLLLGLTVRRYPLMVSSLRGTEQGSSMRN